MKKTQWAKGILAFVMSLIAIALTLLTRYVLYYVHELGHGIAVYLYAWRNDFTSLNVTLGYTQELFYKVPSMVKPANIGFTAPIMLGGVISTTLFMFFIYLIGDNILRRCKREKSEKYLLYLVVITGVSQFILNILFGVDFMYYAFNTYKLSAYWWVMLKLNMVFDWISLILYTIIFYKLLRSLTQEGSLLPPNSFLKKLVKK